VDVRSTADRLIQQRCIVEGELAKLQQQTPDSADVDSSEQFTVDSEKVTFNFKAASFMFTRLTSVRIKRRFFVSPTIITATCDVNSSGQPHHHVLLCKYIRCGMPYNMWFLWSSRVCISS